MNAPLSPPLATPPYKHTPLFPLGKDKTTYRQVTAEGVSVEQVLGKEVLVVSHEALRALAEAAERRAQREAEQAAAPPPKEVNGPRGLEPTRYGDWEKKGIASDF